MMKGRPTSPIIQIRPLEGAGLGGAELPTCFMGYVLFIIAVCYSYTPWPDVRARTHSTLARCFMSSAKVTSITTAGTQDPASMVAIQPTQRQLALWATPTSTTAATMRRT